MRNDLALALILVACGGGVLLGRALPRDIRAAPHTTFTPSTEPNCSIERAELAEMRAQLARCTTIAPQDLPVEPPAKTALETEVETPAETALETEAEPIEEPAEETPDDARARRAGQFMRNLEVWKTHQGKELIFVRHSDHSLGFYPADQQVDDGIIVARRLPSGEIAHYDPDSGLPRTDPSAFRPAPPGSPLAIPEVKAERGPDGLLRFNGEIASPGWQKIAPAP